MCCLPAIAARSALTAISLSALRLFSDSRNAPMSNYPRAPWQRGRQLLSLLDGSHYGAAATERTENRPPLDRDRRALPRHLCGLGSNMVGGYAETSSTAATPNGPAYRRRGAYSKRCAPCRHGPLALPDSPSDNMNMPPGINYRPAPAISRHISQPGKPSFLQVLARSRRKRGGLGICRTGEGHAVFADTSDPGYRALLFGIEETKRYLDRIKRFDMPGFQPRPEYLRELRRYGILPPDFPDDGPINPYETDRAYWESLWWKPSAPAGALAQREQ